MYIYVYVYVYTEREIKIISIFYIFYININILSAEGAKYISWPWLCLLLRWVSLTMKFLGKFAYDSPLYPATFQSQWVMTIERHSGLTTLCNSSGFVCQKRVLKTFPYPGHPYTKEGIV